VVRDLAQVAEATVKVRANAKSLVVNSIGVLTIVRCAMGVAFPTFSESSFIIATIPISPRYVTSLNCHPYL
jgi:hypothetical protein